MYPFFQLFIIHLLFYFFFIVIIIYFFLGGGESYVSIRNHLRLQNATVPKTPNGDIYGPSLFVIEKGSGGPRSPSYKKKVSALV